MTRSRGHSRNRYCCKTSNTIPGVGSMKTSAIDESAKPASDASAFVQKAAHVSDDSNSVIGRVGAAAAVSLGARLLPAGLRFLRRYPIAGTLVVAGIALAVYSLRDRRTEEEYY